MIATDFKLLLLNGQEAPASEVERTGKNGELQFLTNLRLKAPFEGWLERSRDGRFFRIRVDGGNEVRSEAYRMVGRLLDGEKDL